jgi:hypothetical protein
MRGPAWDPRARMSKSTREHATTRWQHARSQTSSTVLRARRAGADALRPSRLAAYKVLSAIWVVEALEQIEQANQPEVIR